jgi:hypothetical protein
MLLHITPLDSYKSFSFGKIDKLLYIFQWLDLTVLPSISILLYELYRTGKYVTLIKNSWSETSLVREMTDSYCLQHSAVKTNKTSW